MNTGEKFQANQIGIPEEPINKERRNEGLLKEAPKVKKNI